jgi:MFS transporter, DHA2 family, multidrug resistance protein
MPVTRWSHNRALNVGKAGGASLLRSSIVRFSTDEGCDRAAPHNCARLTLATQYVLERGERLEWFSDTGIVMFALLAIAGCASFAWWELSGAKTPAVNLKILRERAVWAGTLVFFAMGFYFYAMFVMQPFFTQETLHFTTAWSGYFMVLRAVAVAVAVMVMYPVVSWLVARPKIDVRIVVAVSTVLFGFTWFWQANLMTTTADFGSPVLSQVVGGLFLGLSYPLLNVVVMRAVNPAAVAASLALVRLGTQLGAMPAQ